MIFKGRNLFKQLFKFKLSKNNIQRLLIIPLTFSISFSSIKDINRNNCEQDLSKKLDLDFIEKQEIEKRDFIIQNYFERYQKVFENFQLLLQVEKDQTRTFRDEKKAKILELQIGHLIENIKISLKLDYSIEFVCRLNWMLIQLQAIQYQIDFFLNGSFSHFDKETQNLYSIKVSESYLDQKNIDKILIKIDSLLDKDQIIEEPQHKFKNQSIYEKYQQFRKKFVIPQEKYEQIFRKTLEYSLEIYYKQLKKQGILVENYDFQLEQHYYYNEEDPAEAYCVKIAPFKSKMVVNLARPISIEKCQQLAAHESLHHIQFCLTEIKTFPEFKLEIDLSPISFVFEACAEVAVQIIHQDRESRINFLKNEILPILEVESTQKEIEKLVKIDEEVNKLWRVYTLTSKKYLNGQINRDQASMLIREQGFKDSNNWPNIEFIEKYRSYITGYGYGKELILAYIKQQPQGDDWENFIQYLLNPVPTNLIVDFLNSKNLNIE